MEKYVPLQRSIIVKIAMLMICWSFLLAFFITGMLRVILWPGLPLNSFSLPELYLLLSCGSLIQKSWNLCLALTPLWPNGKNCTTCMPTWQPAAGLMILTWWTGCWTCWQAGIIFTQAQKCFHCLILRRCIMARCYRLLSLV